MCRSLIWWDTRVHLTLTLFAEVGLACELIIILTGAATTMATWLKPWANRGVPVPAMYEWFSLLFIPDAYLKQTSPPYKPATVSIDLSRSCCVCCKCIQLESSSLPLSSTPMLESDSNRSLPWTVNPCEIFECAHLKFRVGGRSKQASKHTHACAQWSHAGVGLTQARPKYDNCKF